MQSGAASDGEIVGFGPAGDEDNFGCIRTDKGGDLSAGSFDRLTGSLAVGVSTGGIPKVLVQEGFHRLDHARIDRGGRIVIEINRRGHGAPFTIYHSVSAVDESSASLVDFARKVWIWAGRSGRKTIIMMMPTDAKGT